MNDIEIFEPGTRINILNMSYEYKPKLQNLNIKFPNRIHMTPFDCNRFDFGKPGGGGVGFAIDIENYLNISDAAELKVTTNRTNDSPLIFHYVRVMEAILKYQMSYHFDLIVSDSVQQHFGIGSSVSVACAVIFGINKMFGDPLSIEEMRHLIAHNFVEEYKGKVTYGLETGVGTSVILKGGLSVIGGELVEVYHRPIPPGYTIMLADPQTKRPESDKPESKEMLNRTFFLDSSYRYIKAYNVLMDIIPAFYNWNLKIIGDYFWDIQYSGTHISMIQSYENFGGKIYDTLGYLRNSGIILCGLSSVGPAIYAVFEEEKEPLIIQEIKSRLPYLKVKFVCPNNNGIEIV